MVTRPAKPATRDAGRPATSSRMPSLRLPGGINKMGTRTTGFVRDTRSELKKVVWPTREEAINLTLIVIAVSVAMGILLGGVDFIFKTFFEVLVTGL
jgi:preprotein translocase subunit SecE